MVLLILLSLITTESLTVDALKCFRCKSDYSGVECGPPCAGEVCVVWKWRPKSELLLNQGCFSGVDKKMTTKIGCRTNYLGASMCLCDDGDYCNNVERMENTLRPLPTVRLPVVECVRKTGTAIFNAPRQSVCSSNYCHMSRRESFSNNFPSDVLTVYNCGNVSEFDFDLRLKSSIDFPGLYANGCYRIQYQPKESVTDCTCSKNHCNTLLPVVQPGPIRCYISQGAKNDTIVDTNNFCDGDYCFVQKDSGKYTKGCISVNERNSWSHLKSGYRKLLGVDQWLCQHHLCNFDLNRVAHTLAPAHKSKYRSNRHSEIYHLSVILYIFAYFHSVSRFLM